MRRESMRLLRHKVLRAMVLSDRITRNACPRSREWIEAVHVVEHIAEVERIDRREVMVHAQSELVSVISASAGRKKTVGADVWLRKQIQQIDRELALSQEIGVSRIRWWHLIVQIRHRKLRSRLGEKDIEELVIQIAADSIYELFAFACVAQL